MSSLMRLFGGGGEETKKSGGPRSAPVNPQATLDKLKCYFYTQKNSQFCRDTLDMIDKRERFLEIRVQKEINSAKQLATKNQRAALTCLKRKKLYEAQIERLRGAGLTIETQISTIEAAATNSAVLDAISLGSRTLQGLNCNLNVDEVETTMDDMREQMELAEEIGTAISVPLGMSSDLTDDQLEEELYQLMESDLEAQFDNIHVPNVTSLPINREPNNTKITQSFQLQQLQQDEEDEFAALGAEMGFGP